MLHVVTIVVPLGGNQASTLDMTHALSRQLHVPRHDITISCLKPGEFIAVFKLSLVRDRALCKGSILVGETVLPLRPWWPTRGVMETTWWFHAKITMENVPWRHGMRMVSS